jgi:hypothetical protein
MSDPIAAALKAGLAAAEREARVTFERMLATPHFTYKRGRLAERHIAASKAVTALREALASRLPSQGRGDDCPGHIRSPKMPLYVVKTGEGEDAKERLVEANNKAVARNFVARTLVEVELAEGPDVHRLAKLGIDIEVATPEPASE